jgi:hypothetical protein
VQDRTAKPLEILLSQLVIPHTYAAALQEPIRPELQLASRVVISSNDATLIAAVALKPLQVSSGCPMGDQMVGDHAWQCPAIYELEGCKSELVLELSPANGGGIDRVDVLARLGLNENGIRPDSPNLASP